jgi:DNA-directed RNA polymerase specialized sigma24 family protein
MPAPEVSRERRQALASFFAANERYLRRSVYRHALADHARIEDACAFAWLKLVSRPDITLDRQGFAWLATVAIHEAWRLPRDEREWPAGGFLPESDRDDEVNEPAGPVSDPADLALARKLHRDRLARFACLKPRERRDLILLAGGYGYSEIAQLTGSTYTAVNRRITEGRARLRPVGASRRVRTIRRRPRTGMTLHPITYQDESSPLATLVGSSCATSSASAPGRRWPGSCSRCACTSPRSSTATCPALSLRRRPRLRAPSADPRRVARASRPVLTARALHDRPVARRSGPRAALRVASRHAGTENQDPALQHDALAAIGCVWSQNPRTDRFMRR